MPRDHCSSYSVGRRRRQASKVRCQQWCHCGRKAQLFHPRNSDPFLLMISSFLHQCYRNPDTSEVKLSKDAWPSVAHTMTITPESGTSSSLRLQLQGLSSFFQAKDCKEVYRARPGRTMDERLLQFHVACHVTFGRHVARHC